MTTGSGSEGERRYRKHLARLLASRASEPSGGVPAQGAPAADIALQQAVGGSFECMGLLERDLVIAHGLQPDGFVIDIGCGSGRLAAPLAGYLLAGRYLGTDVVPELLAHARSLTRRPDWTFQEADGFTIPAADGVADIVCFFSVMTHLLHEESYALLAEAARVVKPSGRIVLSFLEFAVPSHWAVFESTVAQIGADAPHNQFMDRAGIAAWAAHLDLDVVTIAGGTELAIPVRQPVTMEDGTVYDTHGTLGQSFAVLARKPART